MSVIIKVTLNHHLLKNDSYNTIGSTKIFKIYYTKNQGLHTPEIPLVYTHLRSLDLLNTQDLEMAGVEPASETHKI